jgi:aminoglycoside phosphotransferase (APT) family kinase protein
MLEIYWKHTWQAQSVSLNLETELANYIKISESLFKSPYLSTDSVVWTFGDLWPNSILIDEEANRIWFIDWEAARFQVDPLRDLEQLMANLWLMKQNSDVYDNEKVNFLIEELQAIHFGTRTKDWRSLSSDRKDKFIIWILSLIKEEHWKIANSKEVMLKALDEIKNII